MLILMVYCLFCCFLCYELFINEECLSCVWKKKIELHWKRYYRSIVKSCLGLSGLWTCVLLFLLPFVLSYVIWSNVALHLTNWLGLIKINVHYILIIIECHMYIVVLNVLYDGVYMYKSLQITFLFCSILYSTWEDARYLDNWPQAVVIRV